MSPIAVEGLNLVVLRGRLACHAEERQCASGVRLVTFDLIVARSGERDDVVPVAWMDPKRRRLPLDAGEEVVVIGRVRRHYSGSGTRTEVVAEVVTPTKLAKRVTTALTAAVFVIESEVPS